MATLTRASDKKIDSLIGLQMDYVYYRYPWPADLPNHMIWLRLVLFPVQILLLATGLLSNSSGPIYGAVVVLSVQMITDLLDGYVARKHDHTSETGARWDPAADKLMVLPGLLALIIWSGNNWLAIFLFVIMLVLEFVSTLWYIINPGSQSNKWGKHKLHAQVLAVWLGMLVAAGLMNTDSNASYVLLVMLPIMAVANGFAIISVALKFKR